MKKLRKLFLVSITLFFTVCMLSGQISGKNIFLPAADAADTDLSAAGIRTMAADSSDNNEDDKSLLNTAVILDPGHGGEDPGMVLGRIYEKDINLQITEKLRALLTDRGCSVFTTRDDDTYISLEDRVKLTEKIKADLFLSIHLNAVDEDTVSSGIECYCNDSACPGSRQLAEAVQSETVNETCARDRGVKGESDLYVVRKSRIPSCLIEAGFLTSDIERPLLLSDDYQSRIAEGIVRGIQHYLTEGREGNES